MVQTQPTLALVDKPKLRNERFELRNDRHRHAAFVTARIRAGSHSIRRQRRKRARIGGVGSGSTQRTMVGGL